MAIIVVADDEPDLRALYADALATRGHDVHTAADGLQALGLVRSLLPDLLLLDVWMPGLSGFEVLDSMRADSACAFCRVLVISVLDDAETQLEAFGSGAVDFVSKGEGLREIVVRAEALLSGLVVPAPPASEAG